MIAKIGRTLLTPLGLLFLTSTAWAQGNTFNPYGNSGYTDYREFGNPMVSNNPALPGQAILNNAPAISRARANSFQQYSDELDGLDTDASAYRRGVGSNVPYYQAYQRLNSQYNRVYQPNNSKEDKAFYERQKQRDLAFAKALKETDPAKRAKLLRQVELDSLDRPGGATRSATAAKPGAAGSSAAARAPAPAERRTPAPSPYGDAARRPTAGPATRPATTSRTGSAPPPPSSARTGAATNRPAAPDPSTIPIPPPR